SVVASVSIIIIPFLGLEQSLIKNIVFILNSLICLFSVAYFLSDIISNYLFQLAEAKRRDDFFDNSLKTNYSEVNSNEYFTNDDISPGIKKMGINCFENS